MQMAACLCDLAQRSVICLSEHTECDALVACAAVKREAKTGEAAASGSAADSEKGN